MELTAYHQFVELEENHFWFVGRRRIFFHLLERELQGRTGLRVVEVGCGAGGMLGPLARFGTVTGIELSDELAAFCRSRGFERVVVGSGCDLPLCSSSADVLALFDTIEHIPDDNRVLAQCRAALSPGGLLFVSVPAYEFLYANNDRVAHHQRRYTARDLRSKIVAAGFMPTKVSYFNTLLFPLILPTVLAKKVKERWSEPDDTTNLSHRVPARINRGLARTMSSERHLLRRVSFPFGHSIVAIARRPAA